MKRIESKLIAGLALILLVMATAANLSAQDVDSLLSTEPEERMMCRELPADRSQTGQSSNQAHFEFILGHDSTDHRAVRARFDSLGRPRRLTVVALPGKFTGRAFSSTLIAVFDTSGASGGLVVDFAKHEASPVNSARTPRPESRTSDLTNEQTQSALALAQWLWSVRCGKDR